MTTTFKRPAYLKTSEFGEPLALASFVMSHQGLNVDIDILYILVILFISMLSRISASRAPTIDANFGLGRRVRLKSGCG